MGTRSGFRQEVQWPRCPAIARGLRLTRAELNYLYTLCGRSPGAAPGGEHLDAGIQRILDRLPDTPAQVMGQAGITLRQTPPAIALMGDETAYRGLARSAVYRWFTEPAARRLYLPDEHEYLGRVQASLLRGDFARHGRDSLTGQVVRALLSRARISPASGNARKSGSSPPARSASTTPKLAGSICTARPFSTPGPGKRSSSTPPPLAARATSAWRCSA